jgi:hypothetical protein
MRRYKTKQANPTRKIVVRDYSNNKSFTLQVPFSIGREFSIGAIQFVDNGNTYTPVQQIPASWYVNLNV